jgi:hypothetical protein
MPWALTYTVTSTHPIPWMAPTSLMRLNTRASFPPRSPTWPRDGAALDSPTVRSTLLHSCPRTINNRISGDAYNLRIVGRPS